MVIGVEPEAAPTLTRALAAGRPVDAEAGGIAADSLAPRRIGERGFAIVESERRFEQVTDFTRSRLSDKGWLRFARLNAEASQGVLRFYDPDALAGRC